MCGHELNTYSMNNILVSYEITSEFSGKTYDKGEGVLINTLINIHNETIYVILTKNGQFRSLKSNQLKAINTEDFFNDKQSDKNVD